MRRLRRGPAVPDHVGSAVAGRLLATCRAADGIWVACTRDAWWAVAPDGSATSLPWERIHRADWDQETATLRVEPVAEYGAPVQAHSFTLEEPGALLDVLRERVTASVLVQRRVDLAQRRGFTLIGRRPPSGAGEVTWAYELDPGIDPDDPTVVAAAERALGEARESLGL